MAKLGIIGGTGLTKLPGLVVTHRQVIRTSFGEPSGPLTFGELDDHPIVFLARHGYGHTIPPHLVNYRANIRALYDQGVTHIASVATVGGIHPELGPGKLCIPNQIIDYTHGREATFAEYNGKPVHHEDFTWPYCQAMRLRCLQALQQAGEGCRDGGVYAAVQGPRLETRAEIERLSRDGADMVGMTGMPEAYLAKEIGLCYAAVAVAVNWAAGRGDSATGISMQRIEVTLNEVVARLQSVLINLARMDYDQELAPSPDA